MKRLFLIVPLLVAGDAVLAQPEGQPDFIGVARIIAAQDGISVGEAVRRIRLQDRIIRLQQRLAQEDPRNFAGIAIVSDRQRHRIRVKYKGAARRQLASVVGDAELQPESELEEASHSVAELLEQQSRLLAAMDGYPQGVAVGINFNTNGLNLKTADVAAARRHLETAGYDSPVPIDYIAGDPTIIDESRVTGGRNVDGCQTGFVVANYSGQRGVASANHCGPEAIDLQTNEPVGTYQGGLTDDSRGIDLSWFRSTSHTYVNYIFTPNGEVRITSSMGISLMPYNTKTCLSRTQYNSAIGSPAVSCGVVYNANYTFRHPTTGVMQGPWVAVSPQGSIVLSHDGDSGGPWFYGNAAMGIHRGRDPTGYSLFTPVERLSNLSVYVATN